MVIKLFEKQVKKNPHKVAIVFKGKQVTYSELDKMANLIATHLMRKGVKYEVPVVIATPRSLEMIIGILGILKAGGAYVPINLDNPNALNNYILDEVNTHIVLTTSKEKEKVQSIIEGYDRQAIAIDDLLEMESNDSTFVSKDSHMADNLACVLFSSGSTGKQKGVCISYGAFSDFVIDFTKKYNITQNDVFVLRRFYTFAASESEIFPILSCGGKLILAEQSVIESYDEFYKLVTNEGITVSTFVPGELYQFLEHKKRKNLHNPLRAMIVLGERVDLEKIISLDSACVNRLMNLYGTTEVAGLITSGNVRREYYSVGTPVGDISVNILNERLEIAEQGEEGEICLGGSRFARCYLNRPDLTAEKFIADPWGSGGRIYRTGDIGKYHEDGSIELLGRIDNQVKIRGFRVELGEIENIINSSENVKTSVVLPKKIKDEHSELVAFVASDKNLEEVDSFESHQRVSIFGGNETYELVEEFRKAISSKLPSYMMPSYFIVLDKMPLNVNGKIDCQLLLSLDVKKYISVIDYVPPKTEMERSLCKIWEEVLQLSKVGITDNFFKIGGHSLLAIKMLSRVQSTLGLDVSFSTLFEHPTILGFAKNIVSSGRDWGIPKLVPQEKSKYRPLSFAQQRMWVINKLFPEKAIYNVPFAVKLLGKLDYKSLELAIQRLILRHESFRTNFVESSKGEAQQVISDDVSFSLTIMDVIEHDVDQLVKTEALETFDLAKDRPVRVKLLKLSDKCHILLVTMHHIISDAWSMSIFLSELSELYNNSSVVLEDLSVTYSDYAIWQKQWLTGEILEQQLNFWRHHLKNSQYHLDLPYDFKRPLDMKYEGRKYVLEIPRCIYDGLIKLSEKSNATVFMVIFAAVNALLHKYTNQMDIILGTPIANRRNKEIEGVIGFFANTLAVKTTFEKNDRFIDILNNIKKSILLAYENQDIPFEYLVDHLNISRQLNVNPLFQVMVLASKDDEANLLQLNNILAEKVEIEQIVSKFDLIFFAKEVRNKLYLEIEYSSELFKEETVERLARHFCNLLEQVTSNETLKISDIDFLSISERQRLLVEWNNIQVDGLSTQCIHELFEEQVTNAPDSIAVVFEDKQLTYKELNARANQLAHYLRKRGVKSETLVALCVERSLDMLVGILGILKAGGAYVPLDPGYPEDRLKYMLEDTGTNIVVTQGSLESRLNKLCGLIGAEIDIIRLDSDWDKIAVESVENPENNTHVLNLAYIIYTSGSTGKPKGVQIPHNNVIKLMEATSLRFNFRRSDIWSCFHSYAFDFSIWEIFGAIFSGAKILLVSYEKSRYVDEFCRYVSDQNVTMLSQTPSAFYQFSNNSQQIEFPLLRYIVFGGEALDFSKIDLWFDQHGNSTKLINMYGITEITVHATYFEVKNEKSEGSIIGTNLANLKKYILDNNLNLTPIGVVGEIYIGGEGLARGYLNRPDLTAERFIANTFDDGKRLYKTGDIGKYLPDGNIEYIGRIDNQVKIRGFRIELGEIENAINKHSEVIRSVTLVKFDENKNAYLVAYIVILGNSEDICNEVSCKNDTITIYSGERVTSVISDIRFAINKTLPEYMIPSRFVCLNKVPLTENGKIDKKFLIGINDTNGFSEEDYMPPRNETERLLCVIWEETLRLNRVGINDNFFKIGGDSILAIQVVSRARQENLSFAVKDIFSNQTIKKLSKVVSVCEEEEFFVDEASDELMFDIDFEEEQENILENILWKKQEKY